MRDHVLRIEYADICSDFVVASKEIGSGQFGHIRKCVERATGQQYACKTVHKISIRVSNCLPNSAPCPTLLLAQHCYLPGNAA